MQPVSFAFYTLVKFLKVLQLVLFVICFDSQNGLLDFIVWKFFI